MYIKAEWNCLPQHLPNQNNLFLGITVKYCQVPKADNEALSVFQVSSNILCTWLLKPLTQFPVTSVILLLFLLKARALSM